MQGTEGNEVNSGYDICRLSLSHSRIGSNYDQRQIAAGVDGSLPVG